MTFWLAVIREESGADSVICNRITSAMPTAIGTVCSALAKSVVMHGMEGQLISPGIEVDLRADAISA
jgi:hypothetical protein